MKIKYDKILGEIREDDSWNVQGLLPVWWTTGQALVKIDWTDYNTEWVDLFSTEWVIKTVASVNSSNPSSFDFQSFEEAMIWANNYLASWYIKLDLEDWEHYVTTHPIFQEWFNNKVLFIRSISWNKNNCIIKFDPNWTFWTFAALLYFVNASILFNNILFDLSWSAILYNTWIRFESNSSWIFYNCDVKWDDKTYYCFTILENSQLYFWSTWCKVYSDTTRIKYLAQIGSNANASFRNCEFDNIWTLVFTGFVNATTVFRDCIYTDILSKSIIPLNEMNENGTYALFDDEWPLTQKWLSWSTANRPSPVNTWFNYFDTDINSPVWWNWTAWVWAWASSSLTWAKHNFTITNITTLIYTLPSTPKANTLDVNINWILQEEWDQYTISWTTLTFQNDIWFTLWQRVNTRYLIE